MDSSLLLSRFVQFQTVRCSGCASGRPQQCGRTQRVSPSPTPRNKSMADWTPLRALTGQLGSKAQYIGVHRVFSLVSLVGPVTHFVNAPFGRFSLSKSRLNVNGNIGWVGACSLSSEIALPLSDMGSQFIMELVSPVTFGLSLLGSLLDTSPLSIASSLSIGQDAWIKASSLTTPTKILAVLYLVHCEADPTKAKWRSLGGGTDTLRQTSTAPQYLRCGHLRSGRRCTLASLYQVSP